MRNALKMSSTKSCPKYAPKHTIAMKKYQNDEADALYSGWSPSPVESMAKFEMSEMSVIDEITNTETVACKKLSKFCLGRWYPNCERGFVLFANVPVASSGPPDTSSPV